MAASAVANAVCQDRTSGREVSGAAAGRSARVAQERRTACAAGVRGGRCRSGPARMPTARPRLWAITFKAGALAENWLEAHGPTLRTSVRRWPARRRRAGGGRPRPMPRPTTSTIVESRSRVSGAHRSVGQRLLVQSRASSSRLTTSCCRTWPRTRSWTATRSGAPADRVQRETGNGPRRRRAPR